MPLSDPVGIDTRAGWTEVVLKCNFFQNVFCRFPARSSLKKFHFFLQKRIEVYIYSIACFCFARILIFFSKYACYFLDCCISKWLQTCYFWLVAQNFRKNIHHCRKEFYLPLPTKIQDNCNESRRFSPGVCIFFIEIPLFPSDFATQHSSKKIPVRFFVLFMFSGKSLAFFHKLLGFEPV